MATTSQKTAPSTTTGPTIALSMIFGSHELEKLLKNCLRSNIPSRVWAANTLREIKRDLKRSVLYLDDRKMFSDSKWRAKIAVKSPWKKQTRKALTDVSAEIESRIKQETIKAKFNHYTLMIA